ncbi:cyclopropane-fatty-acyl-phospholipid synthase family protein [Clostridium sp. KNHs205]|jgi:cyclopropane-fatty-acyl-phospholipid synthase|uniref:SAM-dependent methyltransferase n=1 Tax=Clostridium sp. KNHs205 TaxID=1449050 RepID=UPI00051BBE85|nr:cyclopropane-fatty-acyl-phospholipid synthase family protein [Clostridium sp. KNHs205]
MALNNLMIDFMKKFDEKPFIIELKGKEHLIGEGEPLFKVKFNKEIPITDLLTSTSIALGEAYMKGDLEIEGDLYHALNCFLGQMGKFHTDKKALKKLIFTSSSKKNQKQEVSSHYDIGNDFYKLWLDESLSYSCAYFAKDTDTLYDAQNNKIDRILKKLYLQPGMELLDIGCGWGSLLIRAVKEYGVSGKGITLSKEQYNSFKQRIEEEGLSDKITVEILDYRDLPKKGWSFDRVVSVGMIEHVGRDNYSQFMSCADSVLKPHGLFLLHYISALREYPGDAWIKKYIFPGGMVPSLREIINLCADYNFYTLDVESLRRHYNRTLRCWDKNFNEHRDEIEKMMGLEFTRMWDLYLCACAATFNNGIIDLHQILISKGINNELPMTRWY